MGRAGGASNKGVTMMNLPAAMNRHIVGISAIAAALAMLGYAANTSTVRRVASLPEEGLVISQKAPTEATQAPPTEAAQSAPTVAERNAPTEIAQMPTETPNAYGRRSEDSVGQKLKEQIKALLPSVGSDSAQKEAANWSREEWQIAEKAVSDHRGGAKAANNSNEKRSTRSAMVWQPPAEIAKAQMNQSR